MDNREKIYEHGGELRNVQDLFEITANHVRYQFYIICFGLILRIYNSLGPIYSCTKLNRRLFELYYGESGKLDCTAPENSTHVIPNFIKITGIEVKCNIFPTVFKCEILSSYFMRIKDSRGIVQQSVYAKNHIIIQETVFSDTDHC